MHATVFYNFKSFLFCPRADPDTLLATDLPTENNDKLLEAVRESLRINPSLRFVKRVRFHLANIL